MFFKSPAPTAVLTANPVVFPGVREGDAGKIRVGLELAFNSREDAINFFVANHLPTVIFDRSRA